MIAKPRYAYVDDGVKARTIRLTRPGPHQVPALLAPCRFKIDVHGRRWGKSVMALTAALDGHGPPERRWRGAIQGGNIWWVVPKYDLAQDCWNRLKRATGEAYEHKDETKRVVILPGGGSVQIKTADDPEMLRSEGLDGVVFDEAAFMAEESWPVVRPALADRQGWAWFISTPNRMNWFYRMFQAAKDDPQWYADQSPTTTETVPQEELDALKHELGSFRYKQEILAMFLEAGGGFFKREYFRFYQNGGGTYRCGDQVVEANKCRRVTTVDLAASLKTMADYTVVSTFAITPKNQLIMLDCIRARMEGPDQVPMIRRAYERWQPDAIHIEKVGYQLALIQSARRDGLPIRELPRDKDKVSRASLLQARMEGGDVWLPQDASWWREAEDELPAFPEGDHDDIVDTMSDGAAIVAASTGFRVW